MQIGDGPQRVIVDAASPGGVAGADEGGHVPAFTNSRAAGTPGAVGGTGRVGFRLEDRECAHASTSRPMNPSRG